MPRGFRPAGKDPGGPPASPEEQERAAREVVLGQLEVMARSRHHLADTLASRGIEPEVAARVLDRFEEVGLVDDAAYAETLIRTQRENRGLSRRGLAAELRRRGVADEDAADALATISADDEYATALRLARKKAGATRALERDVRERRIAGMLARKGYGPGIALRATRAALATDEDGDDDLGGCNARIVD